MNGYYVKEKQKKTVSIEASSAEIVGGDKLSVLRLKLDILGVQNGTESNMNQNKYKTCNVSFIEE